MNRTDFNAVGGEVETMYVGKVKEKSVVAEITLGELHGSTQWAPTASVGFRSLDGNTQLRVFLMQYRPEHTTLVVGYNAVVDGKPKPLKLLMGDIHLHEPTIFRLERDAEGSVRAQVGSSKAVVIGDGASNLWPFISVSSAKATVNWGAE